MPWSKLTDEEVKKIVLNSERKKKCGMLLKIDPNDEELVDDIVEAMLSRLSVKALINVLREFGVNSKKDIEEIRRELKNSTASKRLEERLKKQRETRKDDSRCDLKNTHASRKRKKSKEN